jgi:hypothetical protein
MSLSQTRTILVSPAQIRLAAWASQGNNYMPMNAYDQVFNYTPYITAQANDFWGRDWLFTALSDWLEPHNRSRFFVLTGEPGSGKTSIASRLVQIALGVIAPPSGANRLHPEFLSAIHFCAAGDLRWVGDRHW